MTHANLAAVDALALVLGLTSTRCPLLLVIVVVTLICCLRARFLLPDILSPPEPLPNTAGQVINGPEILNKFVGESEAKVRELFAVSTRAIPPYYDFPGSVTLLVITGCRGRVRRARRGFGATRPDLSADRRHLQAARLRQG